MCLLCTTVRAWVLPVLYHSLQFPFAPRLISFVAKHDVPEEHIRMRLLLVRSLYIGCTPSEERHTVYLHDLGPCVALERLLSLCSELRSFILIGTHWPRFESLLPPHLDKITVGPMHNSISLRQLNSGPPIVYLTSAFTFLTDNEMEDIASYPTMKKIRRLCDANSMGPFWAVKQAFIAAHLQEYEIVICGTPDNTRFVRSLAEEILIEMDIDCSVTFREASLGSWVNLVHQEFVDWRHHFIGMQVSNFSALSQLILQTQYHSRGCNLVIYCSVFSAACA